MIPTLTYRAIPVATGSADQHGCLVLADGYLIAVLVRLSDEQADPQLRGVWFLEAGFNSLEGEASKTFADLDEAGAWIARRLAPEWREQGSGVPAG